MQLSQRQLFLQHVGQTSEAPLMLEIDIAEGIYLQDIYGKKYIDFISGISVSSVGHRHPKVLEAIQDQLNHYMHLMVYGEYVQSPQVKLASRLAEVLPGNIDSVYFVNSGTEAIEGAIKLSRRATGRKKIFSFINAYHGSTNGALSLMSDTYFTDAFQPLLPDIFHLQSEDFRGLELIDESTAAVFVEIVRGEAGAIPVSEEFLKALRLRCTEVGALYIADEIQTGFGRTGKLFACNHYDIIPDIIVLAKGMGGGMPIGAFAAPKSIMSTLAHNPVLGHITTFGGHPVSCAAALASLEVILNSDYEKKVPYFENIIREKLRHPLIKNISGKGLLLSCNLGDSETNFKFIGNCIKNGLITDWFLFSPNRFRIAPPLTITEEELNNSIDLILKSLEEL
jgi:acetylornithine/succinyldiaminopimelate/putrescine aminotransferase